MHTLNRLLNGRIFKVSLHKISKLNDRGTFLKPTLKVPVSIQYWGLSSVETLQHRWCLNVFIRQDNETMHRLILQKSTRSRSSAQVHHSPKQPDNKVQCLVL